MPSDSEHLQQAAADLILLCQMAAHRVSTAIGGAQLHKRQARLLRRRLDSMSIVLDDILTRDESVVGCLPALQRLNSILQDAEALIADFSGTPSCTNPGRVQAHDGCSASCPHEFSLCCL